jgi:hypothetical protein
MSVNIIGCGHRDDDDTNCNRGPLLANRRAPLPTPPLIASSWHALPVTTCQVGEYIPGSLRGLSARHGRARPGNLRHCEERSGRSNPVRRLSAGLLRFASLRFAKQ